MTPGFKETIKNIVKQANAADSLAETVAHSLGKRSIAAGVGAGVGGLVGGTIGYFNPEEHTNILTGDTYREGGLSSAMRRAIPSALAGGALGLAAGHLASPKRIDTAHGAYSPEVLEALEVLAKRIKEK
jgi:hypothetical protein